MSIIAVPTHPGAANRLQNRVGVTQVAELRIRGGDISTEDPQMRRGAGGGTGWYPLERPMAPGSSMSGGPTRPS